MVNGGRGSALTFAADSTRRCAEVKNYETRKKAIRHKGVWLFLTPSALSLTFSAYRAVANGRDSPENFGGIANSSVVGQFEI